ncbi:MAG: Proton/glutamate symporter @ Sodium/glutamate symporter [uncultured Gemmatimonadetes bacterium]|uniref:Proton/glutamate symporter @ Sodium/glutamate symporter n=1 Tax=uncultured Gemmatimonadota bacterium TaxID=203437 RepID=A0A6J4LEX0_9BACT|nr:MAG: Proton/glutamate symporter @ Sodium/glutamate symporter [uncultured Gemmatimonadota bacterium]
MEQRRRRLTLTHYIFIGMALGILLGFLFPDSKRDIHGGWSASDLKLLSDLFVRGIKMIIAPILFATLVMGIAGHGDDLKKVGRLAFRSILYFEIVTTIALIVGLVAVNIVRPGDNPRLTSAIQAAEAAGGPPQLAQPKGFADHVRDVVPTSFIDSMASNNVLQIVFFSILFAVALTQVKGRPKEAILGFCEGLAETMFKLVGIIMRFVPVGVGAALAVTVAHSGLAVLLPLIKLVLTLWAALIVFVLIALLPVALIARVPILAFLRQVREPAVIAFSTTSSDAALPLAMQRMEAFGVPRRIVSFVMPTGYSFNLDGTTLYLALASVFVAQAAGVELTLGTQLAMMGTLMLTSKGVAAVPRASLVILSGTLAAFNLPLAAITVILAVDELMDMARTTVNLVGNCLATCVMARWEGEFTPGIPAGPAELADVEMVASEERAIAGLQQTHP